MKICMQKIAMIRPFDNPKNSNLNLNIDWTIEYTHTSQKQIQFNILLKSLNYDLNFKLEGTVILQDLEQFNHDNMSKIIFHHACDVLMNMFSLTGERNHFLDCKNEQNIFNTSF